MRANLPKIIRDLNSFVSRFSRRYLAAEPSMSLALLAPFSTSVEMTERSHEVQRSQTRRVVWPLTLRVGIKLFRNRWQRDPFDCPSGQAVASLLSPTRPPLKQAERHLTCFARCTGLSPTYEFENDLIAGDNDAGDEHIGVRSSRKDI